MQPGSLLARATATFALFGAPLFAACSASADAEPAGPFPTAPLDAFDSESGFYHVEIRSTPDQPPKRGAISIEYRITEAASGRPADALDIALVPWMPAMGHGTAVDPEVRAQGNGRYVASHVYLFMPGRWQLQTSFAGIANDHAAPAVEIP